MCKGMIYSCTPILPSSTVPKQQTPIFAYLSRKDECFHPTRSLGSLARAVELGWNVQSLVCEGTHEREGWGRQKEDSKQHRSLSRMVRAVLGFGPEDPCRSFPSRKCTCCTRCRDAGVPVE